ncbi:MAG: triose-phosphate isomerase [Solobacterium sp.]|nr:triose-phosphate isomerase [Solobacterium sp.]
MRKPIIVGNWKMNMLRADTKAFFEAVEPVLTGDEKADYGIAAPYTNLTTCVEHAKHLIVAAENCNEKDSGAYTGEVSVPMLQELGVTHCIIGHSERRMYYGETSAACARKAKRLFAAGMTPILCVGETEEEYVAGKTVDVLKEELEGSLEGLTPEEAAKIVIAYEPIWAIGTGRSADQNTAEECCRTVREIVGGLFGKETADAVRIQYGGSVKPENIAMYMACENIDGALIGGASLKADSFKAIIDAVK